jgi:hypothetical protein
VLMNLGLNLEDVRKSVVVLLGRSPGDRSGSSVGGMLRRLFGWPKR